MKKMTTILLVSSVSFLLCAQGQMLLPLDAKKVSATQVPRSIVEAVKHDFPSLEVIEYYLLGAGKIDSEWTVTNEEKSEVEKNADHYNVLIKGKNGGYVNALYNKNGILESMKVMSSNFSLPSAVLSTATTGKYAGYKVRADKFIRIIDKKKNKEYIEVVVGKGHNTKKLYFTSEGEFVREKG